MDYYVLTSRSAPKGESGESFGSKYDLSTGCILCGTGARLTGRLLTKGLKKARDDFFYTLDGDLLISENCRSILEQNSVTLNELSPVADRTGNIIPFFHVNPFSSFPRMLPTSEGLIVHNQCPACQQNGYFNDVIVGDLTKRIPTFVKPLLLHYNRIDDNLLKTSDIFHTWEHMGYSRLKADGKHVVRYARPLLIVSDKLRNALERAKISKLSFSKILFHNSAEDN